MSEGDVNLLLLLLLLLLQAGCDHVVLAVNYRAEVMEKALGVEGARVRGALYSPSLFLIYQQLGIKITTSLETEPLGTGLYRKQCHT